MASIRKEITTSASPDQAWDALRDVGALHTRLVPGFVVDTKIEPGARVVTFFNGIVVREPSSMSTMGRDGWSGRRRAGR